jgi:very-short-patch-repair endonuclease
MAERAALWDSVFRSRDAVAAGVLRPAHLRARSWRRVFQGVYAGTGVSLTHATLCAAALAYVLPKQSVIAGRSAAIMHGAGIDERLSDVEALTPGTALRYRTKGIVAHRCELGAGETGERSGLPITTPERTCWDLAQWLDVVEAVVWIDSLLSKGVVTTAGLERYLARRRSKAVRGTRRLANVLSLVDGRAESPQESRLRTRLALQGIRPPAVQHKVYRNDGTFVARVDLAWPELKVAVEYDGAWHGASGWQIHADRRRYSALAALGWRIIPVTAVRLRQDFDQLVAEIRGALREAAA